MDWLALDLFQPRDIQDTSLSIQTKQLQKYWKETYIYTLVCTVLEPQWLYMFFKIGICCVHIGIGLKMAI